MPLQLALKLNSYFVTRIYVHCAYVSTPQSHLVLYVPEGEDGAIGQHQAGLYRQLRRPQRGDTSTICQHLDITICVLSIIGLP